MTKPGYVATAPTSHPNSVDERFTTTGVAEETVTLDVEPLLPLDSVSLEEAPLSEGASAGQYSIAAKVLTLHGAHAATTRGLRVVYRRKESPFLPIASSGGATEATLIQVRDNVDTVEAKLQTLIDQTDLVEARLQILIDQTDTLEAKLTPASAWVAKRVGAVSGAWTQLANLAAVRGVVLWVEDDQSDFVRVAISDTPAAGDEVRLWPGRALRLPATNSNLVFVRSNSGTQQVSVAVA